jgi:hypothetical protein
MVAMARPTVWFATSVALERFWGAERQLWADLLKEGFN